jgi:hypothetical protein
MILLISTFQEAMIIDMCHECPSPFVFLWWEGVGWCRASEVLSWILLRKCWGTAGTILVTALPYESLGFLLLGNKMAEEDGGYEQRPASCLLAVIVGK